MSCSFLGSTGGRGFAITSVLSGLALASTTLGQGGEDSQSAVSLALNTPTTGTTVGYADDSDEVCPYSGSTSPDVYYSYVPTMDHNLTVDLCESGFDTKTYVYDSNLQLLTESIFGDPSCNDDACSSSGGAGFRSQLNCVPVEAGLLYYIVVDGWDGEAGNYTITTSVSETFLGDPDACIPFTCNVEVCEIGDLLEGEECEYGDPEPNDTFNGGCNGIPAIFTDIDCGDTYCGESYFDGEFRDTDWYEYDGQDAGYGVYTWEAVASFDVVVGRIANGGGTIDCNAVPGFAEFVIAECREPTSITTPILPEGVYWFFVAPDISQVFNCDGSTEEVGFNYRATLSCESAGACCFDDGFCTIELASFCSAVGGWFAGEGTDCATAVCESAGACCFDDGSCQLLLPDDCTAAAGNPQSAGTDCASSNCDGACCLEELPCVIVSEIACATLDGAFQGHGSSCATSCPVPGACCFDDGACTFGLESDCAVVGGIYQGDNITCSTASCPQPGACCFDDGTCAQVAQIGGAECTGAGGSYQGDDTTCAAASCPQPGACCLPDGSCAQSSAGGSACAAQSGVYFGDDTLCAEVACPQPGACCLPDGSCRQATETGGSICVADGGAYLGDDTTCLDGSTAEVPLDFPTIQAAVDSVCDGTEIILAPLVYSETIDLHGKAITLRSLDPSDPAIVAATIIDGGDAGSVVTCVGGEGPGTVLDGLTIRNGSAPFGGGMRVEGSSPTVRRCVLESNNATGGAGGGLYIGDGAAPEITGCTIRSNQAYEGGGVYCEPSGTLSLRDCTISQNASVGGGGGGLVSRSTAGGEMTRCVISGNFGGESGGGGAVFSHTDPVLTDCSFIGNDGDVYGGAVSIFGGAPTFVNTLFNGNQADNGSVMDTSFSAAPTLVNCTIAHNGPGAAVDSGGSSSATLANCIVWDSTFAGDPPTVSYSAVQGGYPGAGNIDVPDPLFVDPVGPDGVPGTEDDDLRLAPGSPCIDAGDNGAVPADVETDLAGNARFLDDPATEDSGLGTPPIVDIGAYERGNCFAAHVPTEIATIQGAIDASCEGGVITIAPGTYFETIDLHGAVVTLRSEDPSDPDVVAATIIDGGGAGSVVTCISGEGADTVIDGLTIRGGTGTLVEVYPGFFALLGGGMRIDSAGPTVTRCVITENTADYGAGVHAYESAVMLDECTITGNTAAGQGGGMSASTSTPALTDCTFSANSAGLGGGLMLSSTNSLAVVEGCVIVGNSATFGAGLVVDNGDASILYCTITGNTSDEAGAGLYLSDSSALVANCLVTGNTAGTWGAGVLARGEDIYPVLYDSTIAANSAVTTGGGLWVGDSVYEELIVWMANCILWGNSAASDPNVHLESGWLTFSSCDVQGSGGSGAGWNASFGEDSGGNIDADPVFVDPDGPDSTPYTGDEDLHLASGSPCIDAGDNGAVPAGVDTDIDGEPRFVDDPATEDSGLGTPPIVDIGADEFQPPECPADFDASGDVGFQDLLALLAAWGPCAACPEDIDGDMEVGFQDLLTLLAAWGPCP